jgi:hypothetical protein
MFSRSFGTCSIRIREPGIGMPGYCHSFLRNSNFHNLLIYRHDDLRLRFHPAQRLSEGQRL